MMVADAPQRPRRIGLMIPCRNTIVEPEVHAVAPAGVTFHVTRLPLFGTSAEQLRQMTQETERAAQMLAAAQVDLLVFHCTAASTLDADMGDALVERIRQAAGGLPALTTSQALLAALAHLQARQIVMVTPYARHINESEVAFFQAHGITVLDEIGLGLPDAESMAIVPPAHWHELTLAHRHPRAQAYFLSCTNIQALPAVQRLEQVLDAPVITSNQAMLWQALRMAGVAEGIRGGGRLFAPVARA